MTCLEHSIKCREQVIKSQEALPIPKYDIDLLKHWLQHIKDLNNDIRRTTK